MSDQLPPFSLTIAEQPHTFLQESAAGLSPSDLADGPKTDPSGPAHVHASHSATRVSKKAKKTSATSGPTFDASSPSAALQRFLGNRLQANLDANGSLEYALTWKHWDMPSGPPICALRARARPTSGKDCSGWPTPQAHDSVGGKTPEQIATMRAMGHGVSNLNEVAHLAGWATPDASVINDGEGLATFRARQAKLKALHHNGNGAGMPIQVQAQLAGWPTPNTPSGGPNSNRAARGAGGMDLEEAVLLTGWNTPRATDESNGGPNQGGGGIVCGCCACGVEHTDRSGRGEQCRAQPVGAQQPGVERAGAWDSFYVVKCLDNNSRRIGTGVQPLAHGLPRGMGALSADIRRLAEVAGLSSRSLRRAKSFRVVSLRGYGNAIVPQLGALFVRSFLEAEGAR